MKWVGLPYSFESFVVYHPVYYFHTNSIVLIKNIYVSVPFYTHSFSVRKLRNSKVTIFEKAKIGTYYKKNSTQIWAKHGKQL